MKRFCLPSPLLHQLWQHAQHTQPQECVGVLGGVFHPERGWRAQTLYRLHNCAPHPDKQYQVEVGELQRTFMAISREKLNLIGIYHSHPLGPALPSLRDIQEAHYDVPYLIADVLNFQIRAFLLPQNIKIAIDLVI